MIKKLFSLLALVLLAASCDNVMDNMNSLQMQADDAPVFHATTEGAGNAAATKVYADYRMRVLWNKNDRITVFNKYTYGYEYSFLGEDGDNAGDFSRIPASGIVTGNPLDYVYAVYPHTSANKISNDGELTVSLPTIQVYKENSFGPNANTMVSVTDNDQLMFRNVGGFLSLKLYGNGVSVKTITIRGNNGEKLAGKAVVTMDVNGIPETVMQSSAYESVSLASKEPVPLGSSENNYTEFWFVIPPTNFTQGFSVTVTDGQGGSFQMTSLKAIEVSRNRTA